MRRLLASILAIALSIPVNGQTRYQIDSLNQLAKSYWYAQSDSVLIYAGLALKMSEKSQYQIGLFQSHTSMCFGYYLKSINDSSDIHGRKALKIAQNNPGIHNLNNTYIFLGLNKMSMGVYHEAVDYFQQAVEFSRKSNDNFGLADASSNIGLAYTNSKNYQKAKQYYRAALKIHDNIDHPYGEVYVLHNLGRIFFETQYYDSATHYLNRVISLSETIEDKRAKFYALSLLGQIPEVDISKTESYLKQALGLAYELNMIHPIMDIHVHLSDFYLNNGQYRLAIQHAKNAIVKAGDGNFHIQKDANSNLVKAYTSMGDYEASATYVARYEAALDSLKEYNKSHASGVLELSELVEEEQNLDALREDLENIQLKNRLQNMIIALVIVALGMALGLIFMQYRAIKKKRRSTKALLRLNSRLDHAMKEKDLILGMVVHDLRSPLDKIYGLSEVFKNKMKLDQEERDLIDLMQQIIRNSKTLTEELLEVNQLETENYQIRTEAVEIKNFIETIIFQYENDAGKKGINLIKTYELEKGVVRIDKSIVQRILENLITNAIKFNDMNGEVFVNISTDDMTLTLSVQDTGPGIPKSEHDKLFQKFSKTSVQPTAHESSSGLGLYIVKHLVNILGGSITVHSEEGQGAEFLVHIPHN